MKYFALVLLVIFTQPLPPLPRQASNEQAEKANQKAAVSNKSKPTADPADSARAVPDCDANTYNTYNFADSEQQESVKQPKIWSRSDILTLAYVILTGLLVLIGCAGILFGLRTLKAVEKQATLMKEQSDLMVKKERAKLRIELTKDVDLALTDSPDLISIDCKLHNYGGSIAFINFDLYKCWIGDLSSPEEPGDAGNLANLPEVIKPGEPCEPVIILSDKSEPELLTMWNTADQRIADLRKGKLCIYLVGTVAYTNIFDEVWIMKFRRRYTVFNLGDSFAKGVWSKYGAEADNEEYKPN